MKFVRQLPFYMMRTYGKKKLYKPKHIDKVIQKYRFNKRFSPIAYALLSSPSNFENSAKKFQPCPTYSEIREKVAKKYFEGNVDFGFYTLMRVSMFKASGTAGGGNAYSANDEYWAMMSEFDDDDA